MASNTEIANLALLHLGNSKQIQNLDTESSDEAKILRRFYTLALDQTLGAFAWPFASRIDVLSLVAEQPNPEWAYAYRYPSDCVKFRRILSGVRNETRQSRVPYRRARDSEGALILTDQSKAQGEYTIRVEDAESYPADFVMAFSLMLAYMIAPKITGGDPFKLKDRLQNEYFLVISQARASAANEEQPEEDPDAELIRARY